MYIGDFFRLLAESTNSGEMQLWALIGLSEELKDRQMLTSGATGQSIQDKYLKSLDRRLWLPNINQNLSGDLSFDFKFTFVSFCQSGQITAVKRQLEFLYRDLAWRRGLPYSSKPQEYSEVFPNKDYWFTCTLNLVTKQGFDYKLSDDLQQAIVSESAAILRQSFQVAHLENLVNPLKGLL